MGVLKKLARSGARRLGYDLVPYQRKPRKGAAAAETGYRWAHIPYDPNGVALDAYARLYSAAAIAERRFYNLGAGSFRHPYWTNIDMPSDWYARDQAGGDMIAYDLMKLEPLPIPDGVAECVYVSHTFEHVTHAAALNAMREAHRILKPGGVFRVTGPDVGLDIAAWRRGDRDHFYYLDLYSHPDVMAGAKLDPDYPCASASFEQLILFCVASSTSRIVAAKNCAKIDDAEVRALFSAGDDWAALDAITARADLELQKTNLGWHVSWWSVDKAVAMLREAGFASAHKSGYGQSLATVMSDLTLFDKQDPKLSFYVEAVKA